jgi:hypothetical protein
MNKGQLTANWKKITLLIINLIILAIACAIVSHGPIQYYLLKSENLLTILVRFGTLRLGQVDQRKLVQGYLDLRQQRHLDGLLSSLKISLSLRLRRLFYKFWLVNLLGYGFF